jgi:hypothetical protein
MTKNNISYRIHTIAIDDENYQTLKRLDSVGDSFNDVVTRLIKIAKRRVEDRQDDRNLEINYCNVKLLRGYGCSIRRVEVAQFDTSEQVPRPSL